MWHYLQEKKKTWLAYPFKRFHLPPPKPNSFTQVLVFKLFTLMSLEFLTSTHSTLFAARLLLPLSLCCKNCKYVKVWSFMSNLSQVQKMIQVHLRVLTSLSVFITSLLWIFRLYLMLWGRIESVELKIFLHVMVKNILMLKKEKIKNKIKRQNSFRTKITFRPKLTAMSETSRNFIQGGTEVIPVPVCISVRKDVQDQISPLLFL